VNASSVAALQNALAAEHAAVYGYGVVGSMLAGTAQADARADWTAHRVARDTLITMLTNLGATPVAASPAYRLPFAVTNAQSAEQLAVALEDGVTRAYLGVVAVNDPTLRAFGAQAMQTTANRAVAWSGTTTAFPGMPAQSLVAVRGQHADDLLRGSVQVVGGRDALRPRPPEPEQAVLALHGVDVLLKGTGPRVGDVHARHPARRSHEPGLKAAMVQLFGQLV
jgi:hypothetical protein